MRTFKFENNAQVLMGADIVGAGGVLFHDFFWSPTRFWRSELFDSGTNSQMSLAFHAFRSTATVSNVRRVNATGPIRRFTLTGTNWNADTFVNPLVCSTDKNPGGCVDLIVGLTLPVDSAGSVGPRDFDIDCASGRYSGRANNNAFVALRGQTGDSASAAPSSQNFLFLCL